MRFVTWNVRSLYRSGSLRPRRRWEDGIRMDLREIGLGGVDWIRLAQGKDRWRAVVSAVMNLRVLAPRFILIPSSQLRFTLPSGLFPSDFPSKP
jgi:hypothetical protein